MGEYRALLVTDIVDSTLAAERLGDASMAALWREHDRRARDLLAQWKGREIDKSDGFLLLFDDPAAAAGYASAYHRALSRLAPPLAARAGLHVGTVELRQNPQEHVARGAKPIEVDGLAKAVAARVMSIALGGQTLATAQALAQLNDARWRSHGHWRMKGLDEPIELFELGDDDAPWTPPPESSKAYRVVLSGEHWQPVRDIRHSLPAERDAFIGRHAELRSLALHLDQGARLVCVLGVGGGGKTRLAQRFGRTWLGDYPGGVWFCDLSQAVDAADIVQAVARGLELDLHGADPMALTGAAIAGRGDCLLILDNFEQVAQYAEATLGQWLERAPRARFIVTSRERLRIAGEQVLLLDPMPNADAMRLFKQRAAAACGTNIESVADDSAIAPLVDLLDGMPLAIELAAARTPVMPPATLLARVGERFKLLTSSGRRLDRQATLRATLDWSWELLGPPERSALAQLSVFEGGASLAAVEAVIDIGAFAGAPPVVDVLQSLVEKSLVRRVSSGRFGLLRTVRDYAAEKLASGSSMQAQGRHARYFASLGPGGAVAERCVELENLLVAVRCAVAMNDPASAAGALEGAWSALRLRGPFDLALELAREVGAMPSLDGDSRAVVEMVAGWVLKARGNVAQARLHFDAALGRARSRLIAGKVLVFLGDLACSEGRNDEARGRLDGALAIARACEDPLLECQTLSSLGNLAERLGRLEEAAHHYLSGLEIARRHGDRRWEGGLLGNLGVVRDEQGRVAQAREHYEAALAVAGELGDRQWEGNTLCNLGLMLQMQGQLPSARDALDRSLIVAREIGLANLESIVLCNLALLAEATAMPEKALRDYEAALKVARDIGDRRAEGQVLAHLGLLHARQGRVDVARRALSAGEDLLVAVSDQLTLGLLLCARAETEYAAGANREAHVALMRATEVARENNCEPDSELGVRLMQARAIVGAPPG